MQVSLVDDIAMLHGMGIRLVLVLGAQPQIDGYLLSHTGRAPTFASGYATTSRLFCVCVKRNSSASELPQRGAWCAMHHLRGLLPTRLHVRERVPRWHNIR